MGGESKLMWSGPGELILGLRIRLSELEVVMAEPRAEASSILATCSPIFILVIV
jgi:hypothetical protein